MLLLPAVWDGNLRLLMLVGRLLGAVVGAKVSSKLMMGVVSSAALVLLVIAIFCPLNVSVSMPAIQSEGGLSLCTGKSSSVCDVLCTLRPLHLWFCGEVYLTGRRRVGQNTLLLLPFCSC
jgi:FHS family L-fucose permease-like MFS transporter